MSNIASLYHEVSKGISKYLEDDSVNEILVNPDGKLWLDTFKHGRVCTEYNMSADEARRIICMMAGLQHKVVSEESPAISLELPSGERFQGLLPPLVANPSFSIRKHCKMILSLDDYVKSGCLTEKQKSKIQYYISQRKNIICSGGTSTGKTTFTNALLKEIAKFNQRVLILEDTRELQCDAKDVVQLKTTNSLSMRDLLKISMRMRPDRIVIGEVRGGEALELLKAWGTGHPGGVATVHAESAMDCIYRLEDLLLEVVAREQPRLIANSVDVIVYLERLENIRKVKEIIEVKNLSTKESQYEFEVV